MRDEKLTKQEAGTVWAHFSEIDEQIVDFATNEALKSSKYIFISSGKIVKGYCTHCKSKFCVESALPIKQNTFGECPKCNSSCQYKKSWVGRKYMHDAAYFLWFEKSQVNPNMIVASWIYCRRDYSEDYENVTTHCQREKLYTFEIGNSAMYSVWGWIESVLYKEKSIHSNPQKNLSMTVAVESLLNAAKGTQFQYSGWEKYSMHSVLKYLDLFSKYPNIEVLTKNGFRHVVSAKMHNQSLYRAINWKAHKLHDFFKMSKQDFRMMRESQATGTYVMHAPDFAFGCWLWQKARKEKSKLSYEEIIKHANAIRVTQNFKKFCGITKYSTLHRIFNYAQKQYRVDSKHYQHPEQVIITWYDYIKDCLKLDMNLKNEIVLYPKNLRAAHQQTLKLVKVKSDEIANLKIQKRYEGLEHLLFEYQKFAIRPPKNFKEIIDEGKVLEHCVARYADDHANGKTTLLFIRKVSDPKKPFHTVEIKGNRIVQVRGFDNAPATDDVKQFIDEFKKQKLTNKKARKVV